MTDYPKCTRCGNERKSGDWPFCPHGEVGPFYKGHASIHVRERVQIDIAPSGEVSVPARVDQPMHIKQQRAGYRRVEVTSKGLDKLAKKHGLIHQATNFNSPPAPVYQKPKKAGS